MSQQSTDSRPNPHPLSPQSTELVWKGGEDNDGMGITFPGANEREMDVVDCGITQIYQRLQTTPLKLSQFCRKWYIAKLAVFGSILRDDFRQHGTDRSDIDFLFCYLPSTNMSLLRRAKMKIEIEELCQNSVDLLIFNEVIASHNWSRKKHILESAKLIYVQQ
ncbi:nucleotidyltransferase domain-containing protein [Spirulina sp. CCNP1310]|uniref:nucleotidyltransferase family protein n=1 Tax=Spirulina sp. CCNP1310 TaxID=3110249 RepID=UPI002B1F4B30|nr:nucleotidyltransferase domain-containing protein [Spirulina sp. CCNP1310]MEA5420304.1 nucleotidyltransferase domain-containing protein [Spirulina sp. CCNP1310]